MRLSLPINPQARSGRRMTVPVEFENGTVEIDASVIAEGLGMALPLLRKQMQAGKITSRSERGVDADSGRYRLTFFSETGDFVWWSTKPAQSCSARRSTSAICRCRNQCTSPAADTFRDGKTSAVGKCAQATSGAEYPP